MQSKRALKRIILTAASLVLAGMGCAFAQISAEQQSAMKANCRSDFISKCMGKASPGTKEALVCLQQNVASLSPACQTAVRSTMAAPAAAAPAAAPPPAAAARPVAPAAQPASVETPKPAAATPPPPAAKSAPAAAAVAPSAPAKPAKSTARKPAPAATPAVASTPPAAPPPSPPAAITLRKPTPAEAIAVRNRCWTDMEIHCRGVPPGDGRITDCLGAHHPALSPGCKTALAPLQN